MKTIVISTQEELNAFNGNFEGNLDLRGWTDRYLYLRDATVKGGIYLRGATIKGTFYFRGTTVGRDLDLGDATFGGNLYLEGATVGGKLYLGGATVGGNFNLQEAMIGSILTLAEFNVGGDFDLQGATVIRCLDLQGAKIVGSLNLVGVSVRNKIDLQRATVGNIWYPTPTKEEADFLSRVLSKNNFDMKKFHSNDLWKKDTQTCGTTHCIRGWAEVEFLENNGKECEDETKLYPNLKWLFYLDNETARAYMGKIIAEFN